MAATKLERMHLTDDDVHHLTMHHHKVPVRIRVWRVKGSRPVVLVEPVEGRSVGGPACRIATFVHHTLMRGQESVYCERDQGEAWCVVTFLWVRHAATSPHRKPIDREDFEHAIGTYLPA